MDGIARCTIAVKIRLTMEQVSYLEANFKDEGCSSAADYLHSLVYRAGLFSYLDDLMEMRDETTN